MKVVIVGGAGFLGTNLALSLTKKEYKVLAIDLQTNERLKQADIPFVTCDLQDTETLEKSIDKDDVVVHFAGSAIPNASSQSAYEDAATHILPSIGLLDVCVKKQAARVIYASSGGQVYGVPQYTPIDEDHPTDPQTAYGIHKLAVEEYMQLYQRMYGLRTIILRFSNPYGPGQRPYRGQGIVATFLASAREGRPVEIWGDGNSVRDYIYIDDLTEAVEAAIRYDGRTSVFNIGSGTGTTVHEIAEAIERATGTTLAKTCIPSKPADVGINILNCNRAEQELSWKASISLADGIAMMIRSHQA